MSHIVDFENVSTVGLESSPVAEAIAGLRAHEARYFMNKYKHKFIVVPASESQETLDYVAEDRAEDREERQREEGGRAPEDAQRPGGDRWAEEECEELGEDEEEGVREDRVAVPQHLQRAAHELQGEELGESGRPARWLVQSEELGESGRPFPLIRREMPAPTERIRMLLAPERRKTAVSLRSYQTALAERESHRHIIEEHESGRALVDAATLKKSEQIVRFYERTIAAYEEQCERRE